MMNLRSTIILLFGLLVCAQGCQSSAPPQSFGTPDDAVNAAVGAARAHSKEQLKQIFGGASEDLFSSGDAVADRNNLDDFLSRYDEKHQLSTEADGSVSVVVGNNDWPMPIPLVKDEKTGTWHFDVDRGKDEILNRRIGRNELDAIQVCLAIADAQRDYAQRDPENTGVPQYAAKILSDPGRKNGLFWKTQPGEPDSPLGELAAGAAQQGYHRSSDGAPRPYHGYFYRMLDRQGDHATGGARSYIVDGKMVGGFAVVAYPSDYENSGIMTFIVNHDGIVYQRDLGESTERIAKSVKEFDPSSDWKRANATSTETTAEKTAASVKQN